MSWSKSTTLWCDGEGCEEWIRFCVKNVNSAEAKAVAEGWKTNYKGEHYCPNCAEGDNP